MFIGISTPVHQETSDDEAEILDDVDIASMQYSQRKGGDTQATPTERSAHAPPNGLNRAVHGSDEAMRASSSPPIISHAHCTRQKSPPEVIMKFKGDVAAIDSFAWHTRTQSASFATDDLCARFVNGFMLTTDHLYTMNKPIDLIHRLTRRTVLRLYPENGLWYISIPLSGGDTSDRDLSIAPSWEDGDGIWERNLTGGPDPLEAASRIKEVAHAHPGHSSRLPDLALLELPIFELLCRMNDADPIAYRKESNGRMPEKTPKEHRSRPFQLHKPQQSYRLGSESVFRTRYATMPMGDAMDLLALARPMEERVERIFGNPGARGYEKAEYDVDQLRSEGGVPQSFAAQQSPVGGRRNAVKSEEYTVDSHAKDIENMLQQQARDIEKMLQQQDTTDGVPEQQVPPFYGNGEVDDPVAINDTTCTYNEPKPFERTVNKMRTATERGVSYQYGGVAMDVPDMTSDGVCKEEDDELRLESEACA